MKAQDIIIREDFRDLIPPLSESEKEQLNRSLDADGQRDPLVIWKGKNILIDGHNRLEWCKHRDCEPKTVERRFRTEGSARNYIILNQLGRRNLSPDAISILRGKLYNSRKKTDGGDRKSVPHCEGLIPQTAEQLATESNVSRATVERDGQFAEAVEKLGVEKDVLSGKNKESRKSIIERAQLRPAKDFGPLPISRHDRKHYNRRA